MKNPILELDFTKTIHYSLIICLSLMQPKLHEGDRFNYNSLN